MSCTAFPALWMLAGEVSVGPSDSFHVKLKELAEKQLYKVIPPDMVLDDGNLI